MEAYSDIFLFQDQISWDPAGDGIRRQILGYDAQVMLVKVEFRKDAIGSEHSHPHRQSTYVASGVFEFIVDGVTKIVKEGDGVYIAPNVAHGVKCIEAGVLIDAFNPAREDFIPT
ncbi:MAG: cupin domain-containing protein [Proteiniphilum sp.]